MKINLVTPASTDLLTKTEMRLHARTADAGANEQTVSIEDAFLVAMGAAAHSQIEAWTNRALLESTWDMCLDEWPCGDTFYLPKGMIKAGSVSVHYTPDQLAERALSPSLYSVDLGGVRESGRVVLNLYQSWPSDTLAAINGVRVRFTAGWATPEVVPPELKLAALQMVAHFYENRESVVLGSNAAVASSKLQMSVDMLISGWSLPPLWLHHK